MEEEIMNKVNEEVKKMIDSYNDKSIQTSHNFNLLKKKILREKYGIDWKPISETEKMIID